MQEKPKKPDLLLSAIAGGIGLLAGAALTSRTRNHFILRGKTVAISGGTRGLGLVLARQALRRGARVSICGRNRETLVRALRDLAPRGEVFGFCADIATEAGVENWIAATRSALGPIEVLVHNAGTMSVGPFESMHTDDFREAMNTHFFGALYLARAVIPEMKSRRQGRIAFVASLGGKRGVPHMLPYDASKFALVGLGEGLSIELAKYGIRVTTVCPGLMRTGSPDQAFFKGDHRAEYAWFSLADSLPGLSASAESAATKILDAVERGKSELVFPITAKWGARFAAAFPDWYVRAMRKVDRRLPQNYSSRRYSGFESHSKLSPSWLTALNEQAAARNNESSFSQFC